MKVLEKLRYTMIWRLLFLFSVTLKQDTEGIYKHSLYDNSNFCTTVGFRYGDTRSSYCELSCHGCNTTDIGKDSYDAQDLEKVGGSVDDQTEVTTSRKGIDIAHSEKEVLAADAVDEDDEAELIFEMSKELLKRNEEIQENVDEVKKVPRKRKWHKGFRFAAGWARNPPPPPDPCNSGPCQNGGACTRTGAYTFSCACVPGYTGSVCSIDINECASSPCQNSATCNNYINYYTCTCVPGYTGTNCQTEINECNSYPCQNGGLCNDKINKYTCDCAPGYTGTNCETDIDECASTPCQNNQTCEDHVNYYTCHCTDRYNGTHCEKDCRPGPADILFLIDASKSAANTLNTSLDFIDRLINAVPIGPQNFQMAAITYSNTATLEFDFDDHQNNISLKNAFQSIQSQGFATYTDVALTKAREVIFNTSLGSRTNAFKYVIILYDGMSTQRTNALTLRENLLPNTTGIRVYAVGVGEQVDQTELLQIVTEPDYVFSATENDAINNILQETSHADCDDCLESYSTDILLMVDSSSSNSVTEFQELLTTTGELVKHLDIDSNTDIQLSLISFADEVKLKHSFGVVSTKDDMLSAIQTITRSAEKASGTGVLTYARQQAFTSSNNGRSSARKIAVLISNAKWNDHTLMVQEAKLLKDSGVRLVNVGTGIDTEIEKFFDIATDAHHVFLVLDQETERLRAIASEAKYVVCDSDIFDKRV